MVTLDALAAYWIASYTTEEKELNVTLSSMGRNGFKTHLLLLNNHQVKGLEEELKVTDSPFPPSLMAPLRDVGQVRNLSPPPCAVQPLPRVLAKTDFSLAGVRPLGCLPASFIQRRCRAHARV